MGSNPELNFIPKEDHEATSSEKSYTSQTSNEINEQARLVLLDVTSEVESEPIIKDFRINGGLNESGKHTTLCPKCKLFYESGIGIITHSRSCKH